MASDSTRAAVPIGRPLRGAVFRVSVVDVSTRSETSGFPAR